MPTRSAILDHFEAKVQTLIARSLKYEARQMYRDGFPRTAIRDFIDSKRAILDADRPRRLAEIWSWLESIEAGDDEPTRPS